MNKWLTKISIGIIIGSFFLVLSHVQWVQNLENKLFDYHQSSHFESANPSSDIVLIELSAKDRVKLVEFLAQAVREDVKLIALDLSKTYQKHSRELLRKLRVNQDVPVVLSGMFEYSQDNRPSAYLMPPRSFKEYEIGFSNYAADRDRVVRQLPVQLAYAKSEQDSQFSYADSFAYQIYKKAKRDAEPISSTSLLIHYNQKSFPVHQLTEPDLAQDLKDKIIIISESNGKQFTIPGHASVSSLELHALTLASLFNSSSYKKPQLLHHLLPFILALLGVAVITPSLKWFWPVSLALALGMVGFYLLNYAWFLNYFRVWLPALTPSLAVVGTWGGLYAHFQATEGKELTLLKRSIKRHLPKQQVKQLLEDKEINVLHTLKQNEKRTATVLFSDITGFAQMTEQLPPNQVIQMLDEFLTAMTEIIFKHHGALDKYMGDGIMAVFGNIGENHPQQDAEHAVRAALQMQKEMESLQRTWMNKGLRPIQIRIGINTGDVLVGHVGHPSRKELTVIGDVVNTASRLEQLNKQYQTNILISQSTYELTKEFIEVNSLGQVELKGKLRPISVYEIKGWKR